jgi:tetratricopeptide (TPR) repeat protein
MELDKGLQDKIDYLINKSDIESQAGNYESSFDLLFKAWDLYPNPKENWGESFNLVTYIISDYMKLGNLVESKKWVNRLEIIDDHLHISRGIVCFTKGQIFFEQGDFEQSRENFKECIKQGEGFRYFEGEDPKYLDFYTHPEKYVNK